jgi:hypothetical protein
LVSIVSVVAGGWSVRGDLWDLGELPGVVIAVNDSALHLPVVHVVVSMDRLWTENRWDWLCRHKLKSFIRTAALKTLPAKDLPWLHPFECDYTSFEFSSRPFVLNGTNSGECALNLAYQMLPKSILLFGFDHCDGPNGEKHWFPAYPWAGGGTKPVKFQDWAKHYRSISRQFKAAGIEVLNMSSRSLIKDFRVGCHMDPVLQ